MRSVCVKFTQSISESLGEVWRICRYQRMTALLHVEPQYRFCVQASVPLCYRTIWNAFVAITYIACHVQLSFRIVPYPGGDSESLHTEISYPPERRLATVVSPTRSNLRGFFDSTFPSCWDVVPCLVVSLMCRKISWNVASRFSSVKNLTILFCMLAVRAMFSCLHPRLQVFLGRGVDLFPQKLLPSMRPTLDDALRQIFLSTLPCRF